MKTKRKVFILIAVLSAILLIVAGCTDNSGKGNDNWNVNNNNDHYENNVNENDPENEEENGNENEENNGNEEGNENIDENENENEEGNENEAAFDPPSGHGLKGDYYRSSGEGKFDFGEFAATSIDPNIGFDDLNPIMKELTGQDESVTIRWTGQLKPNYSEEYTFYMIGDNGFRFWIDDQIFIDHWVNDWDNEQVSEPIALEADQKYDIKIEYFEDFGGAYLQLRWESESQEREIIPSENFYLPADYTYEDWLEESTVEVENE